MMGELINIFLLFVKISMFSFGGGYVTFPVISDANATYRWMSETDLSNILSLAGMSPGSVAINAAIGIGYNVAGIPGVLAAFLGVALPCALIVIFVALFFFKVYKHPAVNSVLFVLRPVITGVILYAGISFAMKNGILMAHAEDAVNGGWNIGTYAYNLLEVKSIILAASAFLLLKFTKVHPILIILCSGVIGILIF